MSVLGTVRTFLSPTSNASFATTRFIKEIVRNYGAWNALSICKRQYNYQFARENPVKEQQQQKRQISLSCKRTHSDSLSNEMDGLKDPGLFQTGAYIGGKFESASNGNCFDVLNPATGGVIASVADCGDIEAQTSLTHAKDAFVQWSTMPAKERSHIVRNWYELVKNSVDDMSRLVTVESGKPMAEARAEVVTGTESIAWCAEECRRICGQVIPSDSAEKRFITMKQPIGIVYAVTPWNFPFSMITRKVAPALAAGCTVCLKPSELTPLTALALAELAGRAGIPPGVFNVITGKNPAEISEAFMKSRDVRKVTFTGSTGVGKLLAARAAETVKRVSLELGGNAPFIVFDDADLEIAARKVVQSSYRNAGQTCICTNRVLVQESVANSFKDALIRHTSQLRLGSGLEAASTMGPLIASAAVRNVDERVQKAVSSGAKLVLGGKKPDFGPGNDLNNGYFFEPTVLFDVKPSMKIWSEEIFGPVTPVMTFEDEADAIQLANGTNAGLASYVFTKNLSRAWRLMEGLEFGMVGVNEVAITSEIAPFGGVKESGTGREQGVGYGLDEFMDVKTICIGLGE